MKLRMQPSGWKTWTTCTAQPHYLRQNEEHLPKDTSSEHSREGDDAHQVVENMFNEDPTEYKVKKFTEDMKCHAWDFRDFCMRLTGLNMEHRNKQWWSERKVKLFYDAASNGKIDFSAITPEQIFICDYKYGQGVAVHAEGNLQMAIYAVSLIQEACPDFSRFNQVTMAIYQPRVRDGEAQTTWSLTYGELLQFVEEHVQTRATQILTATSLRFEPSEDACRWCPAKGFCGRAGYEPTFQYEGQLRAESLLEDTPLAPVRKGLLARLAKPAQLEQSLLARIVLHAKAVKKWLDDVEEYAHQQLAEGKPVTGLKLVQGRGGHRVWRDEDGVKALLLEHLDREEVVTEKLISPSQLDKYEHDLPKEVWENIVKLMHKPEGGPVIASESDKRPAYGITRLAEYAGMLDDETPVKEDWE